MALKKEIISLLEEMASLMEFLGENPFKINAFRNASNTIRRLEGNFEQMLADKSITDVKGIGKGIQKVLYDYHKKKSTEEYDELRNKVPDGILDILKIRGLGARKVKLLHNTLQITSLKELEEACDSGKISEIKGFAKKTQDNIKSEIERIKVSKDLLHFNRALKKGEELLAQLQDFQSVEKIEFTGELRRIREVISKIEFVILVNDEKSFLAELGKVFEYNRLDNVTSSMISLEIDSRIPINLFVLDKKNEYQTLLFSTTADDKFYEKIGFDSSKHKASSEEKIFEKLGFPFIIPEMREHEYFSLPQKLQNSSNLRSNDIKGMLHFHTTYSDGLSTLTEMRDKAEEFGFEYIAVCDHSKTAFYANGLSEERILLQNKEIAKLNESSEIKIYQGIESDILGNGDLDYADDFMVNFNFVVASVHSQFNLSEEDMTARIIKAVENENTDVLGHPTGRLLLSRYPYKHDIKKIIDACAQNNVAIELNANPFRLDLDWRHIYYAREKGCKLAINPDAHITDGILDFEYGVKIARKAGIQKSEVINCFSKNEFEKFLNRKISRID